MKFCFEILHYKTDKDTVDCVESILKMKEHSDIVIVDNASKNGSIERLKEKYGGYKNIYILENDRNLGFAEGNNTGYRFARNHLHADFIMVCNNDLLFDDKDFITKCINEYSRIKAHVIGPDIQSLTDKMHQSPMINMLHDSRSVDKEILRYFVLLQLSKTGLYDIFKNRKKSVKSEIKNSVRWEEEQQNVVLHGAAVLFTPIYVENEEIAFQPGTFLYMEEAILQQYLKKKKYTSAYIPTLHVFHKEDSSTNSLFKASKDKREFVFRNMIKSLKVYKKYLKV